MGKGAEEERATSSRIIQGVGWSYASAIASGLLRIAALSILARLLSPREFGLLGIALIFVSFAERVAQVGLGPALVQRMTVTDRHCAAALWASLVCGAAIFGILWIASPPISSFFKETQVIPILRVLALVFVIEAFAVVPDSILQRKLHFHVLMGVDNAAYGIGTGLFSIILAWQGFGVWSLVAGTIAVRLVRTVLLNIFSPQPWIFSFCWKEMRELLHIGAGFSLGRVLNYCALYGDNFLVGRLLGPAALGLYTRGYQLMTIPSGYFAQVLDRVLFPVLSQRQDSSSDIRRAFLHTLEVIAYVSIPGMALMVFLGNEIVLILFGERWTGVIPVFQILSMGVFFRTAYKVGDVLSRSLGAVYQHAFRQGIYTILVVTGAFIGAQAGGLSGVAWAVLFAVAMNYLLMLILSIHLIDVSWAEVLRAHFPGMWTGAAISTALLVWTHFLREAGQVPIVTLGSGILITCVTGYAAAAFVPYPWRLQSAGWFLRNLPLEKLGKAGVAGSFLFKRQVRFPETSPL